MKKIKIFSALDHLDTYELNRFEKYVKSPYFNTNKGVIAIVEEYQRNRKKGIEGHLDKDKLWSLSFGTKKYSDGRLRKLLSDILRLFENFVCLEHMSKNPLTQATMLVEALEERKIEELYNSSVRNAKRLTSEENIISSRMHYHRYELEKVYYELTDFDIKRNEQSNLSQIISNLDHFYLAEKLKYYCTSISRTSFVEQKVDLLFIAEIMDHISENEYQDVPIVNIWITILKLQTESSQDSESYYLEFKESFRAIISKLLPKESLQIFGYGQNYCAKEINRGNEEYFQELFDLNKIALEHNILLQQNQLNPWLFRNIVTVALRLKEFKWTSFFINEYGKYISEEFRNNAVQYSKAALSFYKNEYGKVLDDLREMKVLDIAYELNSKSLLIMTYFEMQETDALDSLLDSFYVYLNRHKDITQDRRDIYLNLISFTRKLMNLAPSDDKGHQKLLDRLNETKIIGSRAWLKEKILERLN